jgi:hypothetical protein
MVIENSAGEVYGNSAEPFGLPSVASHTDGDTTVRQHRRGQPEEAADHRAARRAILPSTDMKSTGKFADAGDRECQRHHEGDVLLLEDDAESDREDAEDDRRDARDA